MTSSKIGVRLVSLLCLLLLLSQQSSRALPLATDALRFFNNFFVTGDYVVGGVGLWNSGTGTIQMNSPAPPMSAAPAGAEALGAFLYWQVVTSADPTTVDVNAGATFNGLPLNVPLGTQLLPTSQGVSIGTQACLLNGGTSRSVHTYRADVLRFLDTDPTTGLRVINKTGGYPVALTNNSTTRTLGASLVVIYRHPDPTWPLNAIVVYDGTFVKQQPATLNQRIEGFYDPASAQGRITYIAGSAQSSLNERLSGPFDLRTSMFDGASGNAWDNVSVVTNDLSGATYFDTAIAPQNTGVLGFLVNDCIAMGAMVYRTQVNDTDQDGLLNRWEDDDTTALLDPNGVPVPDLRAMGANETTKDIFIEIGAMRTQASTQGTTYGSPLAPLSSTLESVTDYDGHNHTPTPAALQMLGDEFDRKGVKMHFDVGPPDSYHALFPTVANPYAADAYLVGAPYATGGELIDETACEPVPAGVGSPEVNCQFPDYPGTVSWKSGFQLYKEQFFDPSRKDSFRYALYAHAKAAPKSLIPCLAGGGGTLVFDANNDCAFGSNPLFHVPGGVSGSGEYPGGDFLITLGLWDNTKFVGSDFGVASTTMHELGHTLDLGHGGTSLPNCKPNYLSVMNYSFQLSGLLDADGVPHLGYSESALLGIQENGVGDGYHVPGLYRTSWYAPVSATDTRKAKRYCTGLKFDPSLPAPSMLRVDGGFDPVTKLPVDVDWNLNGVVDAPYTQDLNFDGEPDPGDSPAALEGYDDWSHLRLNQVGSRRNFGGISIGPLGVKFLSDGSRLLADGSVLLADGSRLLADGSRLLADGSRLLADGSRFLADGSVLLADGTFVQLADGVRLLSDGSRLLADGSRLLADGSRLLADGSRLLADGSVLLADGSVLLADGSRFLADGSVLLADGVRLLSDGSVFLADGSPLLADGATIAWEFAESTPQVAAESGIIPGPNSLTACVIGGSGVSACPVPPPLVDPPLHRVWLDWKAPNTGNISHYLLYRVVGDTVIQGSEGTPVEVPGTQTFYLDTDELPNGQFTYVVEAVLDDEGATVTPRSNTRTIAAENTKPIASAQAVQVWEDWLSDPITLTGYDPDSAGLGFTAAATSAQAGIVGGTPPNMTYLSAANYNGADSFTFSVQETSTWNGQNQQSDPGTVSLAVTPVNDKPSFVKGANQIVTQPVGGQSVVGWATGFDAGPPDEDLSQSPMMYIVSNDNVALFGAQPAISPDGTLTYTPAAGASGSATVTVQVQDNGGTAEGHGAIDTSDAQTFTITVNPVPATPISFVRTDLWLTTSTSNRKFDVKAQVLRNGAVVAEKEITNLVIGMGSSFSKAVYKQLQPLIPSTSFGFTTTDMLSVKLWVRLSASSAGGNSASAEARFWYNTPGNNSHLHAVRAGTDVKYYMVTASKLQKNVAQAAGGTQYVSVNVKQGQGYVTFGTWSITGP